MTNLQNFVPYHIPKLLNFNALNFKVLVSICYTWFSKLVLFFCSSVVKFNMNESQTVSSHTFQMLIILSKNAKNPIFCPEAEAHVLEAPHLLHA